MPLLAAAPLAALLVVGVTVLLRGLQILLADPEHPYGIAYLTAVALATFLWGRLTGALTLAFSLAATLLLLFPLRGDVDLPRSHGIIELGFLVGGGVVIIGMLNRTRQREEEREEGGGEPGRETEEARTHLHTILNAAPVGVATCDRNGVLDFANSEAERLWGHPLNAVGPERWAEYGICHPDGTPMRPEDICLFRSLRGERGLIEQEMLITRADGEQGRVLARSTAILAPNGSPPEIQGAIVAFVNVTEQRQAEEALRESEENYRRLAERETRRAEWELLLNRIGRTQRTTTSPEAVHAVATEETGIVLGADRCFLMLLDLPQHQVEFTGEWRQPDLPPIEGVYPFDAFIPCLMETLYAGRTLVASERTSEPMFSLIADAAGMAGIQAGIAVPLYEEERPDGLFVVTTRSPRIWAAEEVELTERVAAQMHLSAKLAFLTRREHNIAERLQSALMPSRPPKVPGLDLAAHYTAALAEARVGGDFFDVFPVSDDGVALVIGDLSGKGLAAATQATTIRSMLRFALYRDGQIAPAIQELNTVLNRHHLLTGFASLFVGVYRTGTRELIYVSCGHEPGLLRRAATGAIEELEATAPVLGTFAELDFEQRTVALEAGDEFALFTDGLTDVGRERQEFLGVAGLRRRMSETPADVETALEMSLWIVAGVHEHARGSKHDDQCLLVARVLPGNDLMASPVVPDAPGTP
jgi:PAS domain S-box-containing protein